MTTVVNSRMTIPPPCGIWCQEKASQGVQGNSVQPDRTTFRKGNIWPFQRTINHIHITRLTPLICFQSDVMEAKSHHCTNLNSHFYSFWTFSEVKKHFSETRNNVIGKKLLGSKRPYMIYPTKFTFYLHRVYGY